MRGGGMFRLRRCGALLLGVVLLAWASGCARAVTVDAEVNKTILVNGVIPEGEALLRWEYLWEMLDFGAAENQEIRECQAEFTNEVVPNADIGLIATVNNEDVDLLYSVLVPDEKVSDWSLAIRDFVNTSLDCPTFRDDQGNNPLVFLNIEPPIYGERSPDGIPGWVISAIAGGILLVTLLAVGLCMIKGRNRIWPETDYVEESAYAAK